MKNKDINLKQVMEKSQLTGFEVARVILEDWAFLYQQIQKNITPIKTLISPEQKQELINKIKNEEEYQSYLKFMKLKDWVSDNCVVVSVYKQQCFRIYAELHHKLVTFSICERVKNITEHYPRVESSKKHKTFLRKKVKEVMESKEELNYFLLLKEAMNWYNILTKKNPRKKNPLNELKKELSKETIKGNKYNMDKWEVITNSVHLHRLYNCFEYPIIKGKEKEYLKDFESFKKDFKIVYEMLIKELEIYYPEISTLKGNDWFKSVGTYKDLQEKNFIDVKTLIANNKVLLYDSEYDQRNGVAIIEDEKSFDVRKDLEILGDMWGKITEPAEAEDSKKALYTFRYSLYFIQGFNTAMDIVSEVYGVESVKEFKLDIKAIEKLVDKYNLLVDNALFSIDENVFCSSKEKEEKQKLILDIFKKIDLNSLKAPEQNKEKAKEIANDISFTNNPYFIDLVADIETKL